MSNKDRIIDAVNYIESSLKIDISVSDIAKKACCSLYHFIRLFQSIAGISPKKYLLQLRLTESIQRLRNTDEKIIDIAYSYQFGSHEVYTRAFQKYFGISPSKVRKGEVIPSHVLTIRITKDYVFQSIKVRNQPPDLVKLKEKRLIGVSYFIKGDLKDLDLSKEWNSFMKMVRLIDNKTNPSDFYQIQYWSEDQDIEGMHFFIGMEVKTIKKVNPQFVIKVIPEGSFLKFIHKGLSRNVGFTYRYIYHEFLPETDYKLSMPFNYEYYGKNYLSPDKEESESYIFIPVNV